jgi:D-glycero-D-manno-heptose 1,7-bisphosphate phosphatase
MTTAAAAATARPALFLDRDGTLITDVGYPRDPARVELLPDAIEVLVELQRRFALVIVSNQSGIGRGLVSEAEARAVHDRVVERFARGGVSFAGAYYCPHAPGEGCPCRKPAPGLVLDAARELGLDLARSILLGDKPSDMAAGAAAGCGLVIRFGPDADGDGSAARCDDWPAVGRRLHALDETGNGG